MDQDKAGMWNPKLLTFANTVFLFVPICSYLFHSAESHDLVKAMSSIRKEFHGEATGKEKVPGALSLLKMFGKF